MTLGTWHPTSWQQKTAIQQPVYPDEAATARVVDQIAKLPPLVTSWEVERLKGELGRAARGEMFLLQGGDCAESFDDCSPDGITSKLKILLQMSLVLAYRLRRPVIDHASLREIRHPPIRQQDLRVRVNGVVAVEV